MVNEKPSKQYATSAAIWWLCTATESQQEGFVEMFGDDVLRRCNELYDERKLGTLLNSREPQ